MLPLEKPSRKALVSSRLRTEAVAFLAMREGGSHRQRSRLALDERSRPPIDYCKTEGFESCLMQLQRRRNTIEHVPAQSMICRQHRMGEVAVGVVRHSNRFMTRRERMFFGHGERYNFVQWQLAESKRQSRPRPFGCIAPPPVIPGYASRQPISTLGAKLASKRGTESPMKPAKGATPGISTAHRPKPCFSNALRSDPRVHRFLRVTAHPESAPSPADRRSERQNGIRSSSCQRRSKRRLVWNSLGMFIESPIDRHRRDQTLGTSVPTFPIRDATFLGLWIPFQLLQGSHESFMVFVGISWPLLPAILESSRQNRPWQFSLRLSRSYFASFSAGLGQPPAVQLARETASNLRSSVRWRGRT